MPLTQILYEGTSTLMAKTTYLYDQDQGFLQALPAAPIQHDDSYSTDFVVGRGNLVLVRRWDVNDPTNSTKTESKIGYDIAGSVVFTRDALDHQTTINYNDAFSLNGTTLEAPRSFATFAYPTTVTDADNNSSSLWYRYDFGAKTRAQGPPPQNQSSGLVQTFTYDNAARVKRATVVNTGGYTQYEYGPNYMQAYSSVNTVSADPYSSDSYSFQMVDGLGRVIAALKNHPGSTGGYSAVMTIYDRMGRAIQQSNPTETSASGSQWPATGDDAAGWIYTQQTYDWKGRPRFTINTDGSEKEASYSVCGCAGNEMVTLEDEVLRIQKVYSDILGRQWKTEIMDGASVYSTTVSVYNGRDQVIRVKQYQGQAPAEASSTNAAASCPSGTCQETSTTYDGYGRLEKKHLPQQQIDPTNSASTDHTTWEYNADDSIQRVTDARGASANYGYNNNRRLVSHITYDSTGGAAATPDVSLEYDAVGNRTSMTDGLGSQSYTYDSLSRLASETRTIPNVGMFPITYDYNLADELKTVIDPWGATINYGFDTAGRLNSVTGTGYGELSQILSNLQYRAWGTLKSETYGNGVAESAGYNSRLQMTSFEVRRPNSQLSISRANQYYSDGRLKLSHDALDQRFDRAAAYDHAGRATEAYSGSQARDFINQTNSGTATGPFRQSFQYNTFDQITLRTDRLWSSTESTIATFVNNRRQGWSYDASGELLTSDNTSFTRDVTSQIVSEASGSTTRSSKFDGDGRLVWSSLTRPNFRNFMITTAKYYLNSSVLGSLAVAELSSSGQKTAGNVYAAGRKVARAAGSHLTFAHEDPVTGSRGDSTPDGVYDPRSEYDADGVDIGFQDPTPIETGAFVPDFLGANFGPGSGCSNADPNCATCYLDGFEQSNCGSINWEAAQQCPDNDCGPRTIYDPRSGRNVGVLPLQIGRNTGLWIVSGTVDQYQRVPIKVIDPEKGTVMDSSPGTFIKIGTRSFSAYLDPQNTETGASLAQRAATGLSNHPGLLEQIKANTAAGVDVHIVACQAAKESNYAKLSQVPLAFKNGGEYVSGAVGGDGEIGLLQIFPSTAGVSANALKNVSTNVNAATNYLVGIKNHFNVDMRTALAIYNWGPGKFNKVDQDPNKIFSGSLSYADKILDCASQLYLPGDGNRYTISP